MGWNAVRTCMLLTTVLLAFTAFSAYQLEDADGVGDIIVAVNLDDYVVNADVGPAHSGLVTLTGYIHAVQPIDLDAQYGMIQLEVDAGGWQVTDIPLITVTNMDTEQVFSVSVLVPQGSASSDLNSSQTVTVSGSWYYEPESRSGTIEPVSAMIYIEQYYQYSVTVDRGYMQTSPGGEFDIELSIVNEGNGDDEISVEVLNRAQLERQGFAIILDIEKFPLDHGKTIEVPVHITTPTDWGVWENTITVVRFFISSDQAVYAQDIAENSFVSVYVRQRGVSVPGFELPMVLISALLAALMLQRSRRT